MTDESGFQLKQGGPEVYELCWVRAQMGRCAEELVAAAGVAPGDRVLDVGCGTGVVGEALRAGGLALVDGIDISPEMLAVAGTKRTDTGAPVYRNLVEADLTGPIDIPDNAYGGLISAGTFTHGHLGPESFDELWRVAKPGSPCAFTVRSTHFESMGFAARLDADVANGTISEPQLTRIRIYEDTAQNAAHSDDEAWVVVCRVL